jgi:uncharacterized protein (DUF362 family)
MKKISRRKFLLTVAGGLGALTAAPLLSACGEQISATQTSPLPTEPQSTATSFQPVDNTPLPTNSPATETPTAEPPTPEPVFPDLVVTRNGAPEDLVRRAIAALGGMERFVPPGANVLIKPNICIAYHTYEYASTTNPWVVGALVKMCFEAGAGSVSVFDYPFGGTQSEAYRISGIQEQVEAAGGKMITLSQMKFIETEIPGGNDMKKANIYDDVLKADVLINVPIAKDHGTTTLTLGMKNLMGTVRDREAIHLNINQRIADLTTRLYPALTVIDAVRILTAGGPTGGSLDWVKKTDTIIASKDIVAADSYACGLFGMTPQSIGYIRIGSEMGLGQIDLQKLNIEEIDLA